MWVYIQDSGMSSKHCCWSDTVLAVLNSVDCVKQTQCKVDRSCSECVVVMICYYVKRQIVLYEPLQPQLAHLCSFGLCSITCRLRFS